MLVGGAPIFKRANRCVTRDHLLPHPVKQNTMATVFVALY